MSRWKIVIVPLVGLAYGMEVGEQLFGLFASALLVVADGRFADEVHHRVFNGEVYAAENADSRDGYSAITSDADFKDSSLSSATVGE
jgi:hypothetical protein